MTQTHSKMLTTRRRKQRVKKILEKEAKQVKKLGQGEQRAAGAGAAKKESA